MIGMAEMLAIFSATDDYGISREAISVPLEKADPGGVIRSGAGQLEITVPRTETLAPFITRLRRDLEALGYRAADEEEP